MLKRVLSNPNINSYQLLVSDNKEDEHQHSIFNNSIRTQFINLNDKNNNITS